MYLVHSAEHLRCVGDSLHSPPEDVQTQLQPLQDRTALTVQTQALQSLTAQHRNTHTWCTCCLVVPLRLISHHLSFTAPPESPCLCSAPGGCSPRPGCGRAPPPAAAASGCTDHSGRPGRSERRPSEGNNGYFTQIFNAHLYFRCLSEAV